MFGLFRKIKELASRIEKLEGHKSHTPKRTRKKRTYTKGTSKRIDNIMLKDSSIKTAGHIYAEAKRLGFKLHRPSISARLATLCEEGKINRIGYGEYKRAERLN